MASILRAIGRLLLKLLAPLALEWAGRKFAEWLKARREGKRGD